jgi:hypothetical protein
VQTLLSLQSRPAVVKHLPAEQALAVEHGLPSSQSAPFARLVRTQPVIGLQVSVVHGSLSSQSIALPRHCPPEHVSLFVHSLPSEHLSVLFE